MFDVGEAIGKSDVEFWPNNGTLDLGTVQLDYVDAATRDREQAWFWKRWWLENVDKIWNEKEHLKGVGKTLWAVASTTTQQIIPLTPAVKAVSF